jgi:hypothetical protein
MGGMGAAAAAAAITTTGGKLFLEIMTSKIVHGKVDIELTKTTTMSDLVDFPRFPFVIFSPVTVNLTPVVKGENENKMRTSTMTKLDGVSLRRTPSATSDHTVVFIPQKQQ